MIIAPEFGPGASILLEQHSITMISAKSSLKVHRGVEEAFEKSKDPRVVGSSKELMQS